MRATSVPFAELPKVVSTTPGKPAPVTTATSQRPSPAAMRSAPQDAQPAAVLELASRASGAAAVTTGVDAPGAVRQVSGGPYRPDVVREGEDDQGAHSERRYDAQGRPTPQVRVSAPGGRFDIVSPSPIVGTTLFRERPYVEHILAANRDGKVEVRYAADRGSPTGELITRFDVAHGAPLRAFFRTGIDRVATFDEAGFVRVFSYREHFTRGDRPEGSAWKALVRWFKNEDPTGVRLELDRTQFSKMEVVGRSGGEKSFAVSHLAFAGASDSILFYDMEKDERRAVKHGHPGGVTFFGYPHHLTTGGADGVVRLWYTNGELRTELKTKDCAAVTHVATRRFQDIVVADKNNKLYVWGWEGFEDVPKQVLQHPTPIKELRILHEGRFGFETVDVHGVVRQFRR